MTNEDIVLEFQSERKARYANCYIQAIHDSNGTKNGKYRFTLIVEYSDYVTGEVNSRFKNEIVYDRFDTALMRFNHFVQDYSDVEPIEAKEF